MKEDTYKIGFDMEWTDNMYEGMRMIKSACEQWAVSSEEEYQLCVYCPFLSCCEALNTEPRKWNV